MDFVLAIPEREFLSRLWKTHLAESSSFEDYSVQALWANGMVFVVLGLQHSVAAPHQLMAVALMHLRRRFGVRNRDRFSVKDALAQARAAIAKSPGWSDFQPLGIQKPRSHRTIAAFRAVRGTPPVTTFHGLGRAVFEQESRSVAEWLSHYPSFGGLAIHYYESFRALMAAPW